MSVCRAGSCFTYTFSRCMRSMCRAMCIFCLARYTQCGHWNCGSLPHSHFWWFRSDDLSLYTRPQSGHANPPPFPVSVGELLSLKEAAIGSVSRADHCSHDSPPIRVKLTSSAENVKITIIVSRNRRVSKMCTIKKNKCEERIRKDK